MLIRLSARIEGVSKGDESLSSEDDVFYSASEDGNLPQYIDDMLTRKSISDEDASKRRKQIAQMFQKRAMIEASTETQTTLNDQASRFRELRLDDGKLQSKVQTKDRPLMSNNPYALLQDLNLSDDSEPLLTDVSASFEPVVQNMMPAGDSPFWIRYGNKLRVNGTVEGVCSIE